MRPFESSTRARYWMESFQEFLQAFPAFVIFGIFTVTVLCIALAASSLTAQVLIFAAALFFSRELRSLSKSPTQRQPPTPPQPSTATPSAPQLDTLLNALQAVESRLHHLEATMTSKEYEWERRLYQSPPPSPSSPSSPARSISP